MENPDDQFSLKWNNFQSNLASGFHDLLQEEDMVDVTLAAEGKYLQAHKVILSVCSPYFRDLFKANPCKHPIVILKDVGHQELADMLDFMYRGEASVRQEDLSAFLKLAETLKVKGLAGDKSEEEICVPSQSQPVSPRKPPNVVKKKRVVEATVFEPEDDPGDTDFIPTPSEPKRKRKRVASPQLKTDTSSSSAAPSFEPIVNPKQELPDTEEVEFLDDGASDAFVEYMEKNKQAVPPPHLEDSNLDDITTGDDTQTDMDMTAGGSSALDESSDQVPQGLLKYLPASTKIVAVEAGKGAIRRGPPVSPIWNYFVRDSVRKTGDCKVCDAKIRIAAGTTSGILYHLKSSHPEHFECYSKEKAEWEKLKDFYVYQNYMKKKVRNKVVQVVPMTGRTSAIIALPVGAEKNIPHQFQ